MHKEKEALLSTNIIIMETKPFGFGLEAMITLILMKKIEQEKNLKAEGVQDQEVVIK